MEDAIEFNENGLPKGPKAVENRPDGSWTEYFWDGSLTSGGTIWEPGIHPLLLEDGTLAHPETLSGW